MNRAINEEEFIDHQVFVYPTDSSGVGTSKLLRCLEPTPFFKASDDGTDWESLDDDFSYTLPLSDLVLQGLLSCCFFFLFPPLKRVHVSTFPPKKDVEIRFPSNKLLLSPSTPWELGSPHHLIIATVTTESFEELVQFLMIYRRREGFSHKEARVSLEGERTIVKGSAASWGIKIQTLIFRRGWSMMLDSIFHKQRGRLGQNLFFHAKINHFRSDHGPFSHPLFRSKPCDRFIRSTVKVMPW